MSDAALLRLLVDSKPVGQEFGDDIRLHVHGLLTSSRVNGPGERTVLWLQGCRIGCPDCINPATHPTEGGSGHWIEVSTLAEFLRSLTPHGHYTISGGEPMAQIAGLSALLRKLRAKSVIVFTGLAPGYVLADRRSHALAVTGTADEPEPLVDVFISGPYRRELPPGGPYLSSSNQKLLFHPCSRITREEMKEPAGFEIHIDEDGSTTTTGFPTKGGLT